MENLWEILQVMYQSMMRCMRYAVNLQQRMMNLSAWIMNILPAKPIIGSLL